MNFKSNYRQQGLWAWNDELFATKFAQGAMDECWTENTFSQGPQGALFGARLEYPDGTIKRQMVQARRIQAQRYLGDIRGLQVRHTCGSKQCMNYQHFELLQTTRKVQQG